jgi:hypothetical protein
MDNHPLTTSPLSQLVLIRSPYLQFPPQVSLPYNYTPLPGSLDAVVPPPLPRWYPANSQPSTDFQPLVTAVDFSTEKIRSLKERHEAHVDKIRSWETEIRDREVREKRRIAPGYLDTDQRLLQPTRVDSPLTRTTEDDLSRGIERVNIQ